MLLSTALRCAGVRPAAGARSSLLSSFSSLSSLSLSLSLSSSSSSSSSSLFCSQRRALSSDAGAPPPPPSSSSPPSPSTTTTNNGLRVLVTGSLGQIGKTLIPQLRALLGAENVVATDVNMQSGVDADRVIQEGPFELVDVMNFDALARVAVAWEVNCIIHNASLLSAVGEKNPQLAQRVNCRGMENVLEYARQNACRVFSPSSIAAFGRTTPYAEHGDAGTPDFTVQRPNTMYGVTKVYSELLGEYYAERFGVDFRSLRYPGIISDSPPGGGTTDYAVDIYFSALRSGRYECFLREDTRMPMLYMPDCIDATLALLLAEPSSLTQRVYNIQGMSFTPAEQAAVLRRHLPDFEITYAPDFRQTIADSWPRVLNDDAARRDWHWSPRWDLDSMTVDMLAKLRHRDAESATAGKHTSASGGGGSIASKFHSSTKTE